MEFFYADRGSFTEKRRDHGIFMHIDLVQHLDTCPDRAKRNSGSSLCVYPLYFGVRFIAAMVVTPQYPSGYRSIK